MHTFTTPVLVDRDRILMGLDIALRHSQVNRFNHMHIYAISGLPYRPPGGTLIEVQ
jgi:hypothetical protein